MPCRALEAFRRAPLGPARDSVVPGVLMPCRALEAFRPVAFGSRRCPYPDGLNALSGIGGVQTFKTYCCYNHPNRIVLMPCRALEAFRRKEMRTMPTPIAIPS